MGLPILPIVESIGTERTSVGRYYFTPSRIDDTYSVHRVSFADYNPNRFDIVAIIDNT